MKAPARAGTVVVFAKVPRPGKVKTRLCPPLSPPQAAALYAAMLDDVLAATAEYAAALGLETVLALHPGSACAQWAVRVPGYRLIAQRGASLGARMAAAADDEAGTGPLLLRGSDSPAMPRARFEEVLEALARHDVAIAPDRDGGYSLIGLGDAWPGLFTDPMSTDRVLADTLARADRLGARTALVGGCFDVDRGEDLAALHGLRGAPEADLCPRTLEFLDKEGL